MPRGFDEREEEIIRKALIKEGIDLFSLYGLKKTTIKEITKAVGIAQGSFYKFFGSKEELYFEILDIEGQKIREELSDGLSLIMNQPKAGIKQLILRSFKVIEENQLFKQLFFDNAYEMLVRKLPPEKIEAHIKMDFANFHPFITEWQERGILRQVDSESITGLLHLLFIIPLHKKEIGERVFDKTFELLVDLLVDGLVNEEV